MTKLILINLIQGAGDLVINRDNLNVSSAH